MKRTVLILTIALGTVLFLASGAVIGLSFAYAAFGNWHESHVSASP